MFYLMPPDPGATLEMPPVTPPMTGRTLGATTTYAVRPFTSDNSYFFVRGVLSKDKKKKKKHEETELKEAQAYKEYFRRQTQRTKDRLKKPEPIRRTPLHLINRPVRPTDTTVTEPGWSIFTNSDARLESHQAGAASSADNKDYFKRKGLQKLGSKEALLKNIMGKPEEIQVSKETLILKPKKDKMLHNENEQEPLGLEPELSRRDSDTKPKDYYSHPRTKRIMAKLWTQGLPFFPGEHRMSPEQLKAKGLEMFQQLKSDRLKSMKKLKGEA